MFAAKSFACLFSALMAPALAGSFVVPADISVSVSADQDTALVTGQPITFTISATNHGPNPVETLIISSSDFTNEFVLDGASSDCDILGLVVVDSEFSFYYYYNWIPTLGARLETGETRSCHLTVPLSANAPPVWNFGFSIPDFFIDLDPSNNSASVTLRRAVIDPTPIPALSSRALILLALLMAAMGVQAAGSTARRSARSR